MAVSGGFYLGAGIFCLVLLLTQTPRHREKHNRLSGGEWWWLIAAVGFGAVLGPLALFSGLRWSSGYVASLLLNFEAVFTVGLGALLGRERTGARGSLGTGLVIAGAVALSSAGPSGRATTRPLGALLIVAACACWALDNAFTQRISLRDTRQIVAIKGLAGGVTTLALATVVGQVGTWTLRTLFEVLLVGAVSYGLSIMLFIRGLRELGVIQTGALFALAPGLAAVFSLVLLREPAAPFALLALIAMTGGAILVATDTHTHIHTHAALEHNHVHEHDEYHQHEHEPADLVQVPHGHWHRHARLTHAHPHAHDAHHRHPH